MGYPPLEDLLPKSGYSIYTLVRIASRRATELADGKPNLIEAPGSAKTATVALEEICAGKVVLKELADQFMPAEDQRKVGDDSREGTETEAAVA